MMRRLLFVLLLTVAGAAAAVDNVRPFVLGSMAQIQAEREGKPFMLVFWSLTCTHCPTELKMLGELKRRHPKLDLVLVAADTPDDAPQIAARLAGYGLAKAEQWVFAEDMPERLRFEIDRRWYGEVPRTHFYDQMHQREVKTGLVSQQFVEDWLTRTATPTPKRR